MIIGRVGSGEVVGGDAPINHKTEPRIDRGATKTVWKSVRGESEDG